MVASRMRGTRRVTTFRRDAQRAYVETSVWGMTLNNQPRAFREPTVQFLRQWPAQEFSHRTFRRSSSRRLTGAIIGGDPHGARD